MVKQLKFILSILILFLFFETEAQLQLHSYFDIGENNASEGVFFKNGYRCRYDYQKYSVEAGLQLDLISNNPNKFTGFDIVGSRNVHFSDVYFDLKSFFMLNRFSELQYETNWGIRFQSKNLDHFLFEMGTNFKTYIINTEALQKYNIPKTNSRLHESFNLVYVVSAYLKPHTSNWNVGLSCTNIDYYVINQSTNPVVNLQLKYILKKRLTFYTEAWYKQAGVFNINANYFGYVIRGGIKWEI